jgi:hypothetical protein
MEEFLASDMERVTGVKRTRWVQWRERGWLSDPSVQVAEGHGTRNIWDRLDVYTICLFRNITESGLPRKVAADIAGKFVPTQRAEYKVTFSAIEGDPPTPYIRDIRNDYWERFRYFIYIMRAGKWWGILEWKPEINLEELISDKKLKFPKDLDRFRGKDEFYYKDFPSDFDFVLIFDLQKIKREVDEKIERLKD